MKNTSLCYLERGGQYLMLHRVKKENDENKWEGDKIFLRLLDLHVPFFSLKLVYDGDTLTDAVLNGERM